MYSLQELRLSICHVYSNNCDQDLGLGLLTLDRVKFKNRARVRLGIVAVIIYYSLSVTLLHTYT